MRARRSFAAATAPDMSRLEGTDVASRETRGAPGASDSETATPSSERRLGKAREHVRAVVRKLRQRREFEGERLEARARAASASSCVTSSTGLSAAERSLSSGNCARDARERSRLWETYRRSQRW